MPEVFREGGYRFFFFSLEGTEPPHVHVESAEKYAKFWLNPIVLVESRRMNSAELSKIWKIIEKRHNEIISRWNEHFGLNS
ncbi:MAG TPA: DUF4160 domain-containing protein [Candidatus Methylacidiphilales bacterium]|jgi:hypothetical protein|nr:DUF4160 domain-containing protein [Candidatus Methylacidiphilales bacterium]